MVKVTGSLQKSTEIMKLSNALIRLPQISQTMREMSMEMTKVRVFSTEIQLLIAPQAGIMEEMLEDTLDMDEDEELAEEADAEVDKVLFELTNGKLGEAGSVGADLPVSAFSSSRVYTDHVQTLASKEQEEEAERNMEKYRQQLNGLLS
jgi:charged multivesicular body protein 3